LGGRPDQRLDAQVALPQWVTECFRDPLRG
jgi:hypothetical protein